MTFTSFVTKTNAEITQVKKQYTNTLVMTPLRNDVYVFFWIFDHFYFPFRSLPLFSNDIPNYTYFEPYFPSMENKYILFCFRENFRCSIEKWTKHIFWSSMVENEIGCPVISISTWTLPIFKHIHESNERHWRPKWFQCSDMRKSFSISRNTDVHTLFLGRIFETTDPI